MQTAEVQDSILHTVPRPESSREKFISLITDVGVILVCLLRNFDFAQKGVNELDNTKQPDLELSFNEADDRISAFQEDSLVRETLTKNVDLREYANEVAQELNALEHRHILKYAIHSGQFLNLHDQIQTCDTLLENMEATMNDFQCNLGNISSEIEILQKQSQSMSIRLKNRNSIQQNLNEVLEGVVISPDLIRKICEGEVNEFFLAHLAELTKKMAFVKSQQGRHIRALKEVGPEMERLRLKAAEKSREFLAKWIEALKAANTNIAIIQQNILLKYKVLYVFLLERYSEAAAEIRSLYLTTVGNYYYSSFEKYVKGLQKLQMVIADRTDLIAVEENTHKRALSTLPGIFGSKALAKEKSNVYSLGDRLQVLDKSDSGIILTHIAEEQNVKFPFEAIFKSTSRLLMDNACSEYIFDLDFFVASKKAVNAKKEGGNAATLYHDLFDATLKLLSAFIKNIVDLSFDAVGILLCIRLNNQNIHVMQKRRVPCLENFTNAVNMMLWPRFQAIMDLHIDSLKKATAKSLLPSKDVHPIFITRRYAEFSASILTLNHGYDDALLSNSLLRLRNEVEGLLVRLCIEFSDKKRRLVFLINNYDLVITILNEHIVPSLDGEKQYFAGILDLKIQEYVEEELVPHFPLMLEFLRTESDHKPDEKFEKVALQFNENWKAALSLINQSVMQSFSNFQNGARILHAVLGQLLLSYKQFHSDWDKHFANARVKVQPVGIQNVMIELKKFRLVKD
ncbi:Sac2 family-domain-containing protein [Phlyctochytrium arcticum]|nr:Sac2 family-domain-containing protein [Phlyctochytrium arcticum]